MEGQKLATSLRLRVETRAKIDDLARWYGMSINEVVDLATACLHKAGSPPTPSSETIQEAIGELGIAPSSEIEQTKRGRPRDKAIEEEARGAAKRPRPPKSAPAPAPLSSDQALAKINEERTQQGMPAHEVAPPSGEPKAESGPEKPSRKRKKDG